MNNAKILRTATLSEEKKSAKNDEFFCQWQIFLPTVFFYRRLFLPTINFYRKIFLPTLFYKREHLVFSNLKIPLVYLFQQIFQRCFNVFRWFIWCRDVGQRQTNAETTSFYKTSKQKTVASLLKYRKIIC